MAKKGEKKEGGRNEKRNVLKLEPVSYQLVLYFMGNQRVRHTLMPNEDANPDKDPHTEATAYRCKYELMSGPIQRRRPPLSSPVAIPNLIRLNAGKEDYEKAAKSSGDGGDATNPKKDKVYRIMITDNHGSRHSDLANGGRNLLGAGADTHSRVDNYRLVDLDKGSWLPDISPAVPFRVVARKLIGGQQVDMDDGKWVEVEIKDPVEEIDQNTGKPRTFLEKFYKKYNRNSADPDVGDDNDPKNFEGKRQHSPGGASGVEAAEVLRLVPDETPPALGKTPADKHKVKYAELSALAGGNKTGANNYNAKFELKQEAEEGEEGKKVKARFVDFAFCPWPAGGDNYRFLLRLLDASGADVRKAEENGAKVKLTDDDNKEIAEPYWYLSGRFVIWKKVVIRLVILCNNIAKGTGIDWNKIQTMYRKVFMDIELPQDPEGYRELTVEGWLKELEDHFTPLADATALKVIQHLRNLTTEQRAAEYEKWFFPKPDPLPAPTGVWGRITRAFTGDLTDAERNHFHNAANYSKVRMKEWMKRPLAQRIVNRVCDIEPKLDSPDRKLHQMDKQEGLFVVFTAEPVPACPAVGAYLGDRIFWMLNQLKPDKTQDTPSTTSTVAHELGHTFYLRHSHTDYWRTKFIYRNVQANGTEVDHKELVLLNSSRSRTNLDDHDQEDAYACLQSYSRPITAEPCGLCALVLRFYDRVKMAGNGEYRKGIAEGLKTVVIATFHGTQGGKEVVNVYPLDGGAHKLKSVRKNHHFYVQALGKETAYTGRSGDDMVGRVNLTVAHGPPAGDDAKKFWKKVSGPAVTFEAITDDGYLKIKTGNTTGSVTVEFDRAGAKALAKFDIVN